MRLLNFFGKKKVYILLFANFTGIDIFSQTYSQPNSQSETYRIEEKPSYSENTSRYTITKESNAYRNPKLYGVDYSVLYKQNYSPTSSTTSSSNSAAYNAGKAIRQGVDYHNKQKSYIGIKDLGDGLHAAHFVGKNYYEKPEDVKEKCMDMVRGEALRLGNGGFKIMEEIHVDRAYPYILAKSTYFFQILDKNWKTVLNETDLKKLEKTKHAEKSSARQELLELKELLDSGIITQEEFDTKAKPLKILILAPSASEEQHLAVSKKNAESQLISEAGFLKYDGRNFEEKSKGSLRFIFLVGKKYFMASFMRDSTNERVILEDWLEYNEESKRWTERKDPDISIHKTSIKGFKY